MTLDLSPELAAELARDIVVERFAETGLDLEDTREEPQIVADGVRVPVSVLVSKADILERHALRSRATPA